ncbi:MAG TPA: hypothetical protein VHB93_01680 [Candidatus Paceibacterota bacterium]|nr:hypothetical protein [Candidatus Paceibacterota bacterium]
MSYITNYRWYWVGLLAVIVIGLGVWHYEDTRPGPILTELSTFHSGNFTFVYPRTYEAKEYATGVVSVGENYQNAGFIPLVDVVRYKADPDVAQPVSFDAFMKKQVTALCGSDDSTQSITCTNPVVKPYTSTSGVAGSEVNVTLTKKNLSTGAVTTATYGPIYVFNSTDTTSTPVRYQGVFVYPTFSSFILVGTTSPAFVESLATTIAISK